MADPQSPSHWDAPPDVHFWLHDLGFARLEEVTRKAGAPGWLQAEVTAHYKGAPLKARVDELLAHATDPDTVRLHLVLVAYAIERLKTAALVDVARATLDDVTLKRWHGERGRWARLPLALELYLASPGALLDVTVCDRWHAKRRCVMRVVGRVPKPTEPLGVDQVEAAARSALDTWRRAKPSRSRVAFLRVFERKPDEFIVAFRRPANLASLRDDNDDLLTGFTEEPVILRLCDRAHRVDVTAHRLEDAVDLAGELGSALLGKPVTYIKRRDKVDHGVLDALLARLCNPAADDLQLVEIKAEMPGEPNRPVKAILGNGTHRIEATVHREGERTAFARDWRTVHHVKVHFEGYRFTVHFPPPDGDLVLTYSDLDRDTNVSEEFELVIEKLRDEFGADIRITPRSKDPSGASPRRREKGRPKQLTAEHWTRMVGPVIDDPLHWEEKELGKLLDQGLLRWQAAWFFRCGDPGIDRRKAGVPDQTLDCKGEIEWPASQDDTDPYVSLDETEQSCNQCNQTWPVPAYRPPLHQRWYLELNHDAVFSWLLAKVGRRFHNAEVEAPGVASGMMGGRRTYLVYLGLCDRASAGPVVGSHPVLWVAPALDALVAGDPLVVTGLAELLTGQAALDRLLKSAASMQPGSATIGPSGPVPERRPRAATPRPTMGKAAAQPPKHGAIDLAHGRVRFHRYDTADDQAQGWSAEVIEIAKPHAVGVKLLLALLTEARRRTPDEDSFQTVADLTAQHDDVNAMVAGEVFYKWVKRTRQSLDDVAEGLGRIVVEGNDPENGPASKAHGYRLGRRYPVSGFQFVEVVENWKAHGKNKR